MKAFSFFKKFSFKFNSKTNSSFNTSVKSVLLSLGLGYSYYMYNSQKSTLSCCGIIGYIGKKPLAKEVCVDGIHVLQFRGYDSCGICTYNSEKKDFEITKHASEVPYYSKEKSDDCITKLTEEVPKTHLASCIGIGHTRWATHGRKIELNAHPHIDNSGKISLVHNGIVDNFKEIKKYLLSKNVEIKTETDSELIVQLIGLYYSQGNTFKESVKLTLDKHITGTYALAIMNKDEPDKLIAARNGSPLLVGVGEDFYIISSDSYSFQRYTTDYFKVDNQDIIELTSESKFSNLKIQQAKVEEIYRTPIDGFSHFMIQEIYEQPETLKRAMNFGSRFKQIKTDLFEVKLGGLDEYRAYLEKGKNLCIIATGTSYFASLFVVNLIRKMDIFNTVQIIDACEFDETYLPKENPICIFVSQSGESKDVLSANKGIVCIGVVNKVESTLAKEVLCGVFVNAGREISVASTKAFSGQFVCLTLIALFFNQIKFETSFINPLSEYCINFLRTLPNVLPNFLSKLDSQCHEIAKKIHHHKNMFCLGRGFGEAIAKEISLKIKEVSYIHAEGMNSLSFKHGPIAMIDPETKTPVLIIVDKNDCFDESKSVFEIVKHKSPTMILITNDRDSLELNGVDFVVDIPNNGILSSFFAVFVGQLIGYYCCIEKGLNPDKPRNLSKEVTV